MRKFFNRLLIVIMVVMTFVLALNRVSAPPRDGTDATDTSAPAQDAAAAADTPLALAQGSSDGKTDTASSQPTAIPADARIHVVQSGESLFSIGQLYGIPPQDIAAANALLDPNRIMVRQELIIPGVRAETTPTVDVAAFFADFTPAPSAELPLMLNGIAIDSFIVMTPQVVARIREIYAYGQSIGRDPRAFSKLGDSVIENPHFLARFDESDYDLGEYASLQLMIDAFQGSFGRQGFAVQRGMHSWTALDPMWAIDPLCEPRENVVSCEFRVHNPSFVFIRLGSNDVGVPEGFERNLREIVEFAIAQGVIPLLGTKADRRDGADSPNNAAIRRVALDYTLPLWDFDRIAGTIVGRGLDDDGIHLTTYFAHDYRNALAFQRGHGVHNLVALLMLDRAWRAVTDVG
jgi:LysM repeat protein